MVDYLVSLGHRKISHVLLNTDIGRERMRGYEDGMKAHGLEPRVVSVPDLPANRAMDAIICGREAGKLLAERFPDTTAVFASTDPIGIGVMEYARLHQIRVPAELSVCGSGDLEFAQLSWFEMTTITFERHELGRKAAQLMLKMLRKEEPEPENILSPTRLVIRKSTVSPLNRNS